jgi:hypothetical protein
MARFLIITIAAHVFCERYSRLHDKEQTEITSAGYVHFQGLRRPCREEISTIAEVRKFCIVKYSM